MQILTFWQLMPNSKKYSKDWRIFIVGDSALAKLFRKRKTFTEYFISHPSQWMFSLSFCNKKTALNSINRTLHRYSYPKLQFNAIEGEYVSKKGNNTDTNLSLNSQKSKNVNLKKSEVIK